VDPLGEGKNGVWTCIVIAAPALPVSEISAWLVAAICGLRHANARCMSSDNRHPHGQTWTQIKDRFAVAPLRQSANRESAAPIQGGAIT